MRIVYKSIGFFIMGLMAFALNFSLCTLNAAWNPPVTISNPTGIIPVGNPALSVNASNNGVAVYGSTNTGLFEADIWSNFYTFGPGWGTPVIMSDPSLNINGARNYVNQGDPDTEMNASGYVVAVWRGDFQDLDYNLRPGIFSSTRSSSAVWSSVQRASNLNTTDFTFTTENPAVAVNDSGLGVVIWLEIRLNRGYAMTSFLPFGGSWTTPVELDDFGNYINPEFTPDIAINANGNVVATWKGFNNSPTSIIGAATYDPLTALWTPVILDSNTSTNSFLLPKTGIDANGNAIVVWVRRNADGIFQVVSSSFTNGSGWGAITVIDESTLALGSQSAYVVMDDFGTSTAIWDKEQEMILPTEIEVFSSRLPLGGTWSVSQQISAIRSDSAINPVLTLKPAAVDDNGNVIVIMGAGRNTGEYPASVLRTVQGGWQPAESIYNIPPFGGNQSIGIGSCGFALAIWGQETSQFEADLYASDNLGLTNFLVPSNFTASRCCEKFATQQLCFSKLSWDPASDCVAFYVIRRNGVVIATIPFGGSTSYIDPLCNRNEKATYTLSFINVYGIESTGISITAS